MPGCSTASLAACVFLLDSALLLHQMLKTEISLLLPLPNFAHASSRGLPKLNGKAMGKTNFKNLAGISSLRIDGKGAVFAVYLYWLFGKYYWSLRERVEQKYEIFSAFSPSWPSSPLLPPHYLQVISFWKIFIKSKASSAWILIFFSVLGSFQHESLSTSY